MEDPFGVLTRLFVAFIYGYAAWKLMQVNDRYNLSSRRALSVVMIVWSAWYIWLAHHAHIGLPITPIEGALNRFLHIPLAGGILNLVSVRLAVKDGNGNGRPH